MGILRSTACALAVASVVACVGGLSGGCAPAPADLENGPAAPPSAPGPSAQLDPAVAEAAHASPVEVGWDEDRERLLFERRGALHAWLLNDRAEPMAAKLYAISRVGDERVVASLGTISLAAHERRVVDVPLASLPVQTVHAPSAVTLFVDVEEQGVEKRFPSESLHVAFAPDYGGVVASLVDPMGPLLAAAVGVGTHNAQVDALLANKPIVPSDAAALVERLAAPRGRKLGPDGAMHALVVDAAGGHGTNGIASSQLGAQAAQAGQGALEIPPTVLAGDPHQATVCANYDVTYTDAHRGEDFLADGAWMLVDPGGNPHFVWVPADIPARFAKITFKKSTGSPIVRQLDATGCVKVSLLAGPYTVTVSTSLTNGTTPYDVQKIWSLPVDYSCGFMGGVASGGIGGPNKCKGNDSFTGTLSMPNSSYSKTFTSDGATPAFRVAAVAGHILSQADNGLEAEPYLAYANSGCSSFNWQEACASGGVAYYGLSIGVGNKDTTLEKFIVAHEMGHTFEQHSYGSFSIDYSPDTTAPSSCKCDHVVSANNLHCLQSRHNFSTAHTEGFGQFIAQHAFNRTDQADCTFVYYKEVKPDSGPVKAPPVTVDCAVAPKWLESHCVQAGSGVEWDMLVFMRGATSGTDALTMTELFGVYGKAHQTVSTLTWPALQTAALQYFGNNAANPKYVHFLAAAQAAGVQH